MYSSSRAKPMVSAPTEDTYRGYRVSPNRAQYTSAEGFHQQKNIPAYRVSPSISENYENGHYLQKSVNAPGYYRSKRPVEITEILENDRIVGLDSNSDAYDSHSYNYYDNPHTISKRQIPFLSTRAGSNKDEERLLDSVELSNATHRATPSSKKDKNNTFFTAEKVHSMKMRSRGIMAALTPIGKSKQSQPSSKNITPVPSHSAFREADDYSSYLEASYRVGDTSLVETSGKNRNTLQKNTSTSNSLKSLRNPSGTKKELNILQNSIMRRENSCKQMSKSPIRMSNDKKLLTERGKGTPSNYAQTPHYQTLSAQKKSRDLNNLEARIETFTEKVDTVMWQICQRNKRIVLVKLLEMLHHHKLRLTQFLERKTTILKSKYFCIWQTFLLQSHFERQRVAQEKAEEMKCGLAGDFYERKQIKKAFQTLIIFKKRSSDQETPKENTTIHKSTGNLHKSNVSSPKGFLPKNQSTPRNSAQPKSYSSTPKSKPTKVSIERDRSAENKKGRTYSRSPASKESSSPATRSKSVGKVQKGACAPLSSREASTQKLVAKNEPKKPEATEAPVSKAGQIRFPTFGRPPAYYYEPSEIQELTELSQSPQKEPVSYKSNGLDQSFGCENLTQNCENVQGAFDSILADILDAPHNEQDNAGIVAAQPDQETAISGLKINDFERSHGSIAPKSARDYLSSNDQKEPARAYSLSARFRFEVDSNSNQMEKSPMFPELNRGLNIVEQDDPKHEEINAEALKIQKAIAFYNNRLCQKSLNGLMCGSEFFRSNDEESSNLDDKIEIADNHYYNNLKIKTLSGLLENYVHAYKDRERCKEHYEKNLLKRSLAAWSQLVPKTTREDQVSEATYNEIVTRFRFIVLTEKALRQWRNLVDTNKRCVEK